MLHNEGRNAITRRITTTFCGHVYMLALMERDNHRIAPTRSTCAVVVSSQNVIGIVVLPATKPSPGGFSGFDSYSHLTGAGKTKTCTGLPHVRGRQQCLMAQLMLGTNLVNFVGAIYLAEGSKGFPRDCGRA
jgi:hypothetical protein